jgi:hypothetical protein
MLRKYWIPITCLVGFTASVSFLGCDVTEHMKEVQTAPAATADCTELTHTTHGKTCYLLRCDGYRLTTLFCEDAK